MSIANDEHLHNIYKNDPVLLKSYINKCIKLEMRDGSVNQGILYTVDPVSESYVLIEQENDEFHAKVIIGQSIKNVEVTSDAGLTLPQNFLMRQHQMTEKELAVRRTAIKKLFLDNRFPVSEKNGILEIEGMLFIEPPYRLDNCISSNTIILSRVQSILSKLDID